jgi:hypothetical protein
MTDAVHTRTCTGMKKRSHVYMNFFDHKDIGNHLLQLCLEVVKHPVFKHVKEHRPRKFLSEPIVLRRLLYVVLMLTALSFHVCHIQ